MKTIYKLFSYTAVLGLMAGCQPDLLETVPNDRISTEIFWETEEDAIMAANAVYSRLVGMGIVAFDGITDILETNRTWEQNHEIQRGLVTTSTSRFLNEWNNAYSAIRRANDFFDNVDRLENVNQDVINTLKGEVMVNRVYHYIKLVMLYGDVPLITSGINISEGVDVSRTPVEEIWDFIESELSQAASWLPEDNGGRIARGTALALKARAMLYAGRYAESAEAAQEVINSGVYSLYPDYYNLFQYEGQNNQEILLQRERARDINSHNIYNTLAPWSQVGASNGSEYVPTAAIVEMYGMDNGLPISEYDSGFDPFNPYENRDPRLGHSVFLNGITELPNGETYVTTPGTDGSDAVQITIYSTSTGYNVRKYVSPEDHGRHSNSGLNTILMRFAEVLLTYAEAKIELNEIDESVYNAINEVRERPSVELPPITPAMMSSQSELREIVRNERTVELAFEGFRLFDIRRWQIAEDVIPGRPMGITYIQDGEIHQVEVNASDRAFNPSRDYLWPIPERAIELSPHLTQNPGW